MDDAKIEHLLRQYRQKQQKQQNSTAVQRNGSTKIGNPINLNFSVLNKEGIFRAVKTHFGLYIFSSKFEQVEESFVNLIEVSLFVSNYLVSTSTRKKHKTFVKVLRILDKVIIFLRFKILVSKVAKFVKLKMYYRAIQKKQEHNERAREQMSHGKVLTLEEDLSKDKIVVLKNLDNELEEGDTTIVARDATEAGAKDDTKSLFEQIWKETSGNETSGDLTYLTEFKSTEDEIKSLSSEILVELVDFVLLLYPVSITETLYAKFWKKK